MDFNLTEEQQIIKDAARSFLAAHCGGDFVREMEEDELGFTEDLWQGLADLGWPALIVPEEYDGLGGSFLDLVLMVEETGRACLPGPFLSTVVGGLILALAGSEDQKRDLLPRLAAGRLKLSLAESEPDQVRYDPANPAALAVPEGEGFTLSGTKLFVPQANSADYLICPARLKGSEGLSLFLVPVKAAGLSLIPLKTLARDKLFAVELKEVALDQKDLLGRVGQGWPVLKKVIQAGALLKCAEMIGGGQKVLDMTVDYAKERVQFGKPIGVFQAVQHHCANMFMDLQGSRLITYKAAWEWAQGKECDLRAAAAKAWVNEAYRRICALGHQIGAGTAYMVEHDMTLYSRRAKAAEYAYGDSAYHFDQVALALGL